MNESRLMMEIIKLYFKQHYKDEIPTDYQYHMQYHYGENKILFIVCSPIKGTVDQDGYLEFDKVTSTEYDIKCPVGTQRVMPLIFTECDLSEEEYKDELKVVRKWIYHLIEQLFCS